MKRWMKLATIVGLLSASVALTQNAPAQTEKGVKTDTRVKAALDKAGLKYQIDDDGDFKLVMTLPSGRTQLVFVRSSTQKLGDSLEIREILSPGYKSNGTLPADVANQLLADNSRRKLGAWQIMKGDNASLAVFCSKVMATSNAESLVSSIQATVMSADEMEKKLTNKDDF